MKMDSGHIAGNLPKLVFEDRGARSELARAYYSTYEMVYYNDARKVKFSFDGKVIDAYQMDEEDIKFVKEERLREAREELEIAIAQEIYGQQIEKGKTW
ncbi:MAG: hypothetical protein LBU15_02050 [Rickettsiales bacterium]|jgi:3-methyladenine DNA glycosylase AlkC|nr:hypothetical protein [Rickettsiales bacterium]